MIETPEVSFCVSSNRPFLWKRLYDDMSRASKSMSFEIVIVGPKEADFQLPSNLKYIKTGNIKVPQCFEISMKQAQGRNISFIGDDSVFDQEDAVFLLYKEYQEYSSKNGKDIIMLPRLRRGVDQPLKYGKTNEAPLASLNCALFDRNLLKIIGGADIRFIAVYWDCDMAMRFWEAGISLFKSQDIIVREYVASDGIYLHQKCKPYDKDILDSFWTRRTIEGENVPSESVWCYRKDKKFVVSKKRLKEFTGYKDENIMVKSQGVCSYGELLWD